MRRRSWAVGGWVALLLGVGGCHLLLPFTSGDHGDQGASDAGNADRAVATLDANANGEPDATPLLIGCDNPAGEPPLAAGRRVCSCGNATEDCDGLLGLSDPQPADCNPLLYEETFNSDPLSRWQTHNGDWRFETCGWLDQRSVDDAAGTPFNFWPWARADAALQTANYLVETRVRLGEIGSADFWQVSVTARHGAPIAGSPGYPDAFITCTLRIDRLFDRVVQTGQPVVNADLKVELRSAAVNDPIAGWPLDNPGGLDVSAGKIYRLQLWVQTGSQRQVICRLLDDGGEPLRQGTFALYTDASFDVYLPDGPGSVGLRTWDRAAAFDYLRVYQLAQP